MLGALPLMQEETLVRLGHRVLHLEAELVLRQLPVALERIPEALRQTGCICLGPGRTPQRGGLDTGAWSMSSFVRSVVTNEWVNEPFERRQLV